MLTFLQNKLQDDHDSSNGTPEKVNMPELTAFFILLTLNSSYYFVEIFFILMFSTFAAKENNYQ